MPTHGPAGAVLVWKGEAGGLEVGLECWGRLSGMGLAQPLGVVGLLILCLALLSVDALSH